MKIEPTADRPEVPSAGAARHLWPHFSGLTEDDIPVIVRGAGTRVFDSCGREFFDALSGLYCVNVGYGRREIAEAMARQAAELSYFPIWGTATPPAAQLAERIADLTPPGLDRVFFTSGGSEAIDSALKLARQYHYERGRPGKVMIVTVDGSYHGTTFGALSVSGIKSIQEPFEPLVPGMLVAPKVHAYRAGGSAAEHSLRMADAIEKTVESTGADAIAAVLVEPVQNSGGCLVAEPEYFARVRDICDRHDLLLISDETICSWGRIGTWFGSQALGYAPDMITTAKGLTSGYAPMGAVIASDKVAEPFERPQVSFQHGITFGGHPVAAAAALASIGIIEREGLCERAVVVGLEFRAALETLRELPIVGDVRGVGMFQCVELVRDAQSRESLSDEERRTFSDVIPPALRRRGVLCRAMHRGAPLLQFAPPLISTGEELRAAVEAVREVLHEAEAAIR